MSVLNFVLVDKNCRVFNSAVACLAKIGTEIVMDWRDDDLTLRALTDTASAYCAVVFQPSFFDSLSKPSELEREEAAASASASAAAPAPALPASAQCKTKFNSRVLAWACKATRNITRMHAYFAQQDSRNLFVLRVELRSGLVRTHALHYADAAILQPAFAKDASPFQLCTAPSMLRAVLDRMHGTEEMSILAAPSAVQFQSYHDPASGGADGSAGGAPPSGAPSLRGPLHSALAYNLDQFDGAHLDHAGAGEGIARPAAPGNPFPLAAITCGVRELRHLLAFCESTAVAGEELAFYFSTPGAAVLFSTVGIKSRPFRVDLILATVEGPPVLPAPSSALALLLAEALAGARGEQQQQQQQQQQQEQQEQEQEQQEQQQLGQQEGGEGGEQEGEEQQQQQQDAGAVEVEDGGGQGVEQRGAEFLQPDTEEGMGGEEVVVQQQQQQPAPRGTGGASVAGGKRGGGSLDPAVAIKRRLAAAEKEGRA